MPSSRTAGIAVQKTSRRVLPWIGGPSFSSSPGLHAELPDPVQDHRHDEHEDRDRGDHEHVVEAIGVVACVEACGREPVDHVAEPDADRRSAISASAGRERERAPPSSWAPRPRT